MTSGVYIAKLTRLDDQPAPITSLYRPGRRRRPMILFSRPATLPGRLTTDGAATTSMAGPGNSNSTTGRAYKVSLNRPFSTRDYIGTNAGPQDFVFGAEIAAIRWLEANGYDVSYMAGLDMDRLD